MRWSVDAGVRRKCSGFSGSERPISASSVRRPTFLEIERHPREGTSTRKDSLRCQPSTRPGESGGVSRRSSRASHLSRTWTSISSSFLVLGCTRFPLFRPRQSYSGASGSIDEGTGPCLSPLLDCQFINSGPSASTRRSRHAASGLLYTGGSLLRSRHLVRTTYVVSHSCDSAPFQSQKCDG